MLASSGRHKDCSEEGLCYQVECWVKVLVKECVGSQKQIVRSMVCELYSTL